MKKKTYYFVLPIIMLLMVACSKERSLQKYYVENQNNENFVVVDIPANLFLDRSSAMPEETREALKTIKKANVIAYPVTEKNQATFEDEKAEVEAILSNKKYKMLMKFGASGKNVRLMYLGEKDAIDEFIVYGSDSEKGFAVARILGEKMNPNAMIKLMKSAGDAGDGNINVNMKGFERLEDIFDDTNKNENKPKPTNSENENK